MIFTLKHFDKELITFSLESTAAGFTVNIIDMNGSEEQFFPLDLELTETGLLRWLKKRTIPANRYYVENFLAKLGLNIKDTLGILTVSYGLSLNDCYWVCPEYEERSFEKLNLYDNKFSAALSMIAFTGNGSYLKTSFRSSPEFTTNGMLAKAWRRINGETLLYKSGTEGAANTGREPYSEFYAYQIAEKMGIDSVKYGLSKWKGRLCSTCPLFTSKKISFISASAFITEGGIDAAKDYCSSLGKSFYDAFVDMIVFDALIYNTDRHLGNFGFLIDNESNTIVKPAPLFDHGLSLFCYAMESDIQNIDKYKNTLRPATYESFEDYAKMLITERQRKMLTKLMDFKFSRHPRYNLDKKRLEFIEKQIKMNAIKLL